MYLLRLASEGVQSILPSTWQGKRLGVKVQAWGCVSLSDVLLMVEVKYDVVTHLLCSEMLQEHYSKKTAASLGVSYSALWSRRFTFLLFFLFFICRFLSCKCLGSFATMATTQGTRGAGGSCRGGFGVR